MAKSSISANAPRHLTMLTTVTALTLGLTSACTAYSAPKSIETVEPSSLFDAVLEKIDRELAPYRSRHSEIPIPKDAGGGYTHEKHKQNGRLIYLAGQLYSFETRQEDLTLARDLLLEYAGLYPKLGPHPEGNGQTTGRLFWQNLNESVWLVYAIQGYAAIKENLSAEDRETIEEKLLIPMADFLSSGSPDTFNRIHNHGTWAAAAVGMTGYILNKPELVESALSGLNHDGKRGYLAQLDQLFSPDGYYAEGPYYQRYALMPFVLFAQTINEYEPERAIFDYRDGILLKAINATIQQSYNGKFFPINDAIREKGLDTVELQYALAIAYDLTNDPGLLGAARYESNIVPTREGQKLADALDAGLGTPFPFRSMLLRDGPDGHDGGVTILRPDDDTKSVALVLKAASQGMGHGHFDRLGLLFYDHGTEVLADYGAARFLNVEAKHGGRYLPENESWAKQTIAHNAPVIDGRSQFKGDWKLAQEHSPEILAFGDYSGLQLALAETGAAYPGIRLRRLVALLPTGKDDETAMLDVTEITGNSARQIDLPYHFKGQLIETSFPVEAAQTRLEPLGEHDGYQHLWRRAQSDELSSVQQISWLLEDRFYTMTTSIRTPFEAIFTELGANDPEFNLRREQAVIFRTEAAQTSFVSVLESHGRYDSANEVTEFGSQNITSVDQEQSGDISIVRLGTLSGELIEIFLTIDSASESFHTLQVNDAEISWKGPVYVRRTSL